MSSIWMIIRPTATTIHTTTMACHTATNCSSTTIRWRRSWSCYSDTSTIRALSNTVNTNNANFLWRQSIYLPIICKNRCRRMTSGRSIKRHCIQQHQKQQSRLNSGSIRKFTRSQYSIDGKYQDSDRICKFYPEYVSFSKTKSTLFPLVCSILGLTCYGVFGMDSIDCNEHGNAIEKQHQPFFPLLRTTTRENVVFAKCDGFTTDPIGFDYDKEIIDHRYDVIVATASFDREITHLDKDENDASMDDTDNEYYESERFQECLENHQKLLPYYVKEWRSESSNEETVNNTSYWPRRIPTQQQVSSLEFDLQFCLTNSFIDNNYHRNDGRSNAVSQYSASSKHNTKYNQRSCQDTQFKIASYYTLIGGGHNDENTNAKRKAGFRMLKKLAKQGHPDAMCLMGILLNEGLIPGIDMNPKLAVYWWRRCFDEYCHVQAMYELGNAFYLGVGVAEDPMLAVFWFKRAATLLHPGAAYMYGQCLLDGVGIGRDRALALDWFVKAALVGHRLARERVLLILNAKDESLDQQETRQETLGGTSDDGSKLQQTENARNDTNSSITNHGCSSSTNTNAVVPDKELKRTNIERRYTIGGSSSKVAAEERGKWINSYDHKSVNIERRYSIGGGASNPVILARRETKVAESRDIAATKLNPKQ